MNGYNIYSQGTFTFYSNPNEDEDRSEWPPSRCPGQGWKGSRSSLEYVVNCITWAFLEEKEKRSEKPETRYGLVNDYIRISGEAKNNKRQ